MSDEIPREDLEDVEEEEKLDENGMPIEVPEEMDDDVEEEEEM